MKIPLLWLILSHLVVAVVLFLAGCCISYMRNGYFYEVRSARSVTSPAGQLTERYVTRTKGLPFMDPGTSEIALENPGGGEVLLYSGNRVFQENVPFVDDLSVTDGRITWSDGIRKYALLIEPLKSN